MRLPLVSMPGCCRSQIDLLLFRTAVLMRVGLSIGFSGIENQKSKIEIEKLVTGQQAKSRHRIFDFRPYL